MPPKRDIMYIFQYIRNFFVYRYTKNSASGFAIGTILLAVILIAAIVTGMAISSRSVLMGPRREDTRVIASSLINEATNLKTAIDRFVMNGVRRDRVLLGIPSGYPGAGSYGLSWGLIKNCNEFTPMPSDCLYNPQNYGYATPPNLPDTAFLRESGTNALIKSPWGYWNVTSYTDHPEMAGRASMIATRSLRKEICQHVNNLLNGTPITAEPENAGLSFTSSVNSTVSMDIAGGQRPTIGISSSTIRPEGGCVIDAWGTHYIFYSFVMEGQ